MLVSYEELNNGLWIFIEECYIVNICYIFYNVLFDVYLFIKFFGYFDKCCLSSSLFCLVFFVMRFI